MLGAEILLHSCYLLLGAPGLVLSIGGAPVASGGITISTSLTGNDALETIREGEWSMGSIRVRCAPGAAGGPIDVRITGGGRLAPLPALLRRGSYVGTDGTVRDAETYLGGVRRDGSDVVARLPAPGAGKADQYDLVDLTHSSEWTGDPQLVEDPKDSSPAGSRQVLTLIHGQERPRPHASVAGDPQLGIWADFLAAAGPALRSRYKILLYRYPLYRPGPSAATLVRRLKGRLTSGRRAVLVGHGVGAAVARQAAAAPELRRRLLAAVLVAERPGSPILNHLVPTGNGLSERAAGTTLTPPLPDAPRDPAFGSVDPLLDPAAGQLPATPSTVWTDLSQLLELVRK